MSKRQFLQFLRSHATNLTASVSIVAVFALVGFLTLHGSHAATYATSAQAESGTVSGNAAAVSVAGASGGSAVTFGVSSGSGGGGGSSSDKPDATNTGVPAGETLTVVTGNQTFGSSSSGQTISNKEFRGYVTVTGSNITFKNCKFRGGTPNGSNQEPLDTQAGSGTNIVVQDSEIAPTTPAATVDTVIARNTTFLRVNIHGGVDGMKASSNVTLRDSYIHDLSYFASDPNQGGGPTHNDAIQILDGTNIHIIHSNLVPNLANKSGSYANSSMQITQDFGKVGTIQIDKNWLNLGGCTLNIASKGAGALTGIAITDNRFGRDRQFNNCTVITDSSTKWTAYSGNVWDDTGQPIPSPQSF